MKMKKYIRIAVAVLLISLYVQTAFAAAPAAVEKGTPAVTKVTLSPTSVKMCMGSAKQLTVNIKPAGASKKVTWSSSKPSVASVSSDGLITAKKNGKAVITVKSNNGKKATCTVTVTKAARRALLIGQTNYLSGKLGGPENDLAVMKTVLERSGYADIRICRNLTAYGIVEALWDLSYDGGTQDDVTFFYYSGHGMESKIIANRGALIGVDENYLPVNEVRIILDYVPGTVVAVFDSCLSGQFIQTRAPGGASEPADPDAFNQAVISAFSSGTSQSRSFTDHVTSAKYKILTAAEPLQSSYSVTLAKNKFIGLMTYYFARGAGVDAIAGTVPAYADKNKDKAITLKEMHTYIKNNVKNVYLKGKKQNVQAWPENSNYTILTVP